MEAHLQSIAEYAAKLPHKYQLRNWVDILRHSHGDEVAERFRDILKQEIQKNEQLR